MAWVQEGQLQPGPHEHSAADVTAGVLEPTLFPRVLFGGYATAEMTGQTGGETLEWSSNSETYTRLFRITLSTSAGMNTIVEETGAAIDGQTQEWHFLAEGGTRNVQFDSSYKESSGVTRGPYEVPQNEVLFVGMKYSAFLGAWTIVAATVSES